MKASFGVGVILALVEKYNIDEPFLLICGSGSAGTGAYFLSKQYQSIRNIWINLVSSKKLLNIKRFWKIVDIDYLIDEIFKKQDPLKEELVYKAKTRYLIPALNKETGEIDYFDNKNGMNVLESMRAAKSMPIAFKINPSVRIGRFFYCDSIVSSSAQAHIQKAKELGAKKILIVDGSSCQKKDFSDFFFHVWMLFHKCKRQYYEMEKKLANTKVPADVKMFTISPKSKIKVSMFNNNKKSLQQTIDQGYQETIANNDLKEFLGR